MAQENESRTLLTSAARTATAQSADQDNPNGQAVTLVLDVTASPNNAETLTVSVQGRDAVSASGKYQTIASFTALAGTTVGATATTQTYFYTLDPASAVAALANQRQVVQGRLPRTWRAVVTHSASGSWTYTLGALVN